MIYITQGHELGIGLEVFFKSFLTLSKFHHSKFTLIVNRETLVNYLKNLHFNYEIKGNLLIFENYHLKLITFESGTHPQSTISLEIALNDCIKS